MTESNVHGRMIEINRLACEQLLGMHDIGRLALCAESSPEVLPIHYALRDNGIVFRTGPGAIQAAAEQGQHATFQLDRVGEKQRSAWSVMVRGRLEKLDDDSAFDGLPETLTDCQYPCLVRLQIDQITGRRVPPDGHWVVPTQVWHGQDGTDLMA
ncbi:MAG TPA: pyridoxamine 5'-phosphate oxidase family protein [Salinisphaeraceae bacterium]|nr:pyridoxamine 5'-phosphate oxidase family protein [Salinisphaeraceae bacterium]